MKDKRAAWDQAEGISRREILKKVAKGGSVAALISGGAFDVALEKYLWAAEVRKYLSDGALKEKLGSKGLTAIRDLLSGEYYPGGRFYKTPTGDYGFGDGATCDGDVDNPDQGRCDTNMCDDFHCNPHTCLGEYWCEGNACPDQTCGGVEDRCETWVGPAAPPDFDLGEIGEAGSSSGTGGSGSGGLPQFLEEMMAIRDFDLRALELEVRDMIINRQTFKDRGYVP